MTNIRVGVNPQQFGWDTLSYLAVATPWSKVHSHFSPHQTPQQTSPHLTSTDLTMAEQDLILTQRFEAAADQLR